MCSLAHRSTISERQKITNRKAAEDGAFAVWDLESALSSQTLAGAKRELAARHFEIGGIQSGLVELGAGDAHRRKHYKVSFSELQLEINTWKKMLNDIYASIHSVEQRLIRLVESEAKDMVSLQTQKVRLSTAQKYLSRAQRFEQEWRKRMDRAKARVLGLEQEVDEQQTLSSGLQRKLEHLQVSFLQAKRLAVTKGDNLLKKGVQGIEESSLEEKHDVGRADSEGIFSRNVSPGPEVEVESLKLGQKRLESLRIEFKSYRDKVKGEMERLTKQLVSTQGQLGFIKGSSKEREDLVTAAQSRLRLLSPWIGIKIVKGGANRLFGCIWDRSKIICPLLSMFCAGCGC